MTTTQAAKTKIRRVKENAEQLAAIRDDSRNVVIERVRHTLKEGEDIMLLSSDGVGFSGYVYGFEKVEGGMLALIDLD